MAANEIENPVDRWHDYYLAAATKPLHPLYSVLEPHLPDQGEALELGCGVGTGVLWLLSRNFRTTAIDLSSEALGMLDEKVPAESRERLQLVRCDMRDFPFSPESFDLVVASFSLFFLPKPDIQRLWLSIRSSLKRGGLFMGQFLGVNDEWAARCATHSRSEVESLFQGMDILHLEEVERDGQTAQGTPKHWHVYHCLTREPRTPRPSGGEGQG